MLSTCLYEDYKYFGLEVNNDNKEINAIVQYGLELIMKENKDNNCDKNIREISELINNDMHSSTQNHSDKQWRFVSNFHLTTIYKPSVLFNHPASNSFIEGKKQRIKITGMVYVVNKILSFIVNVNTPIQNKIPHITVLLNGNNKANYSNDVLEALFGYDNYLKKHYYYYSVFNIKLARDIVIEKINIKILNSNETIHIAFFKDEFILDGKFKAYKKTKIGYNNELLQF